MKYDTFAKPLLLPEVIFTAGALYYLPCVSSGGGSLKTGDTQAALCCRTNG